MKKTAISFLFSAALLVATNSGIIEASPRNVNLTFNGQTLVTEVPSYIDKGTTFVPISVIAKLKGLSVHWMEEEGTARLWIDRGGVYELKPGTTYVNDWGIHYPLGAEIRMKDGVVMLPLRFIAELTGANVFWDKNRGQVRIVQERTAVASVPGTRNRLYPVKEQGGEYRGIQLEWNGLFKTYPWVNPSSIEAPPQLFIEDINDDGRPEAVVTLNTGRGTGLYLEELHVIENRSLKEIPVEDPLESLEKRVRSSIDKSGEKVVITIVADGKKTVQHRDKSLYGPKGYNAYEELAFGAVIRYGVRDNRLMSTVAAASSITNFEGDIEIIYAYENSRYIVESITYVPFED